MRYRPLIAFLLPQIKLMFYFQVSNARVTWRSIDLIDLPVPSLLLLPLSSLQRRILILPLFLLCLAFLLLPGLFLGDSELFQNHT